MVQLAGDPASDERISAADEDEDKVPGRQAQRCKRTSTNALEHEMLVIRQPWILP